MPVHLSVCGKGRSFDIKRSRAAAGRLWVVHEEYPARPVVAHAPCAPVAVFVEAWAFAIQAAENIALFVSPIPSEA